jgi:uncharacterized membrane protein YdjX (TVP38/TMEM64 family)
LCPIIPFTTLNLAMSLTSISTKDYLKGTLGLIPGLLLRLSIGITLFNLTLNTSYLRTHPVAFALVVITTAILILVMVYMSFKIKSQLK